METKIKEKRTTAALRPPMVPMATGDRLETVGNITNSANPVHILPLVKSKEMCYYDLLDEDKVVQLKNFVRFHKKINSALSESFVGSAMHELLHAGEYDSSLKDIIVNTFDTEGVTLPIGALVLIHQHANLQHPSHFYFVESQWRYWRAPAPQYMGNVGNDALSSLEIFRYNNQSYYVYLFEHNQYDGRYINYYGGSHEIVNYVGDHFNDITSSVLIVKIGEKDKSLPVALFRPAIQNVITGAISNNPAVRLDGDLTITWSMWPSFAIEETFIKVEQPIKVTVDLDSVVDFPSTLFGIDLPDWPSDYSASISYYIEISVVNGTLTGRVRFHNAIVESGIFSSHIREALMTELNANASMINGFLADVLKSFTGLNSVYLLPGNSLSDGHTNDGVIIRLVRN